MRLVDANVLIYATNSSSPQHSQARAWIEDALNGAETVGFCWVVLLAFLRITTRGAIMPSPLSVADACSVVKAWLAQPPSQVVHPTSRHAEILFNLLGVVGTGANLTTDAHLAALAIEHGAELWSFDGDFARFPGLAFRRLGV